MLTPQLVARPQVAAFVGRVEGAPVASAMLIASGPVAGIYWVATVPEARRRGYGEALTWAAVEAGRRAGCAVASLQASAMGRPVYARMGFQHVIDYERFQRN
jgi:GNAT superfamily N-acetyltransferase